MILNNYNVSLDPEDSFIMVDVIPTTTRGRGEHGGEHGDGPGIYQFLDSQLAKVALNLLIFRDQMTVDQDIPVCRHKFLRRYDKDHPFHPFDPSHPQFAHPQFDNQYKDEDFIPAKINGSAGEFKGMVDRYRQVGDRSNKPNVVQELFKLSRQDIVKLVSPDGRFAWSYAKVDKPHWFGSLRYQLPTACPRGRQVTTPVISKAIRHAVYFVRGSVNRSSQGYKERPNASMMPSLVAFLKEGARDDGQHGGTRKTQENSANAKRGEGGESSR